MKKKSYLAPNLFSNQAQFNAFNGSLNLAKPTPPLIKATPPTNNPPINQVGYQIDISVLIFTANHSFLKCIQAMSKLFSSTIQPESCP